MSGCPAIVGGEVRQVEVEARFDRLDGSPSYTKTTTLCVHGDYTWMHGGPTGFESLPTWAVPREDDGPAWCACFGTPGRWQSCTVPREEMNRAAKVLGIPLADITERSV